MTWAPLAVTALALSGSYGAPWLPNQSAARHRGVPGRLQYPTAATFNLYLRVKHACQVTVP